MSNLVKAFGPTAFKQRKDGHGRDAQTPSSTDSSPAHHCYTFIQPGRGMSVRLLVNVLIPRCLPFEKYLFKESLASVS